MRYAGAPVRIIISPAKKMTADAMNGIEDPEDLKGFTGLDYRFAPELSSEREFVFLKEQ